MIQDRAEAVPADGGTPVRVPAVPGHHEIDRAAMAAHRPRVAGGVGCRWLMLAAEMAGLAGSGGPPPADPAAAGWACSPRIATRAFGADPQSVRAARDFTVAILHRWGMAERSPDIAIVVSELLTNALWHARAGPGDIRPGRPIRLGLLQPGPCVLCAVADPSKAAPAPRTPDSLAETGRGLHIVCALSDQWGCTTPGDAGKVVWALFRAPPAPPSAARYPSGPGRDRSKNLAAWESQPA